MEQQSKDPLHGKKLVDILEELVDYYQGFEELGNQINIRCFTHDPSIKSSLRFLRKTEWARDKVEYIYLRANKLPLPPPKAEASQTAKKPAAKIATKKWAESSHHNFQQL